MTPASRPVRRRAAAALADPGLRAALVLTTVVLAGFAGIAVGWRGVAANLYVPLQVPFLVSAAVGGVALAGTAAALLAVHLERRAAAVRRRELDSIIRTTGLIAQALRRRHERRGSESLVLLRNNVHRASCRVIAGRTDSLPLAPRRADDRGLRRCRICFPAAGPEG